MSHVTTVDLEVKDLDCLAKAAEFLGLELVRDVKTYKWWGRFVGDYNDPAIKAMGLTPENHGKCEHKLRVKGAGSETYEIGLVMVNGSWRLLYDFYAGGQGLMEKISRIGARGKDCELLVQEYAAEVAKKQLRRKGLRFIERRENGKIKLTAQV